VKSRIVGARTVTITIVLLSQLGFLAVQNQFIRFVSPAPFPRLPLSGHPRAVLWRQRTTEFFGLNISHGRSGVLQKLGRPDRAEIYKIPDFLTVPYPTRTVEVCVYHYPAMRITFLDGLLTFVDITGEQWRFPLGVKVGDPESILFYRLGKPGWQYSYAGQRQFDWDFGGRLFDLRPEWQGLAHHMGLMN
jgi:hypothetical protein